MADCPPLAYIIQLVIVLAGFAEDFSNDFGIQENEWVAPQFHRKVHVNNRIYIEGAGIEKVPFCQVVIDFIGIILAGIRAPNGIFLAMGCRFQR